ncbi:hypothetical protein EHS25_007744 [Saitozyma podzolica]|uniref:Uncharacterized protein n=1 Tax=Saitozyma podzolica TaxID=1890683 RepID=A0A427YQK2_9TREE|nr:hypothetical protein EHS25_007744 [Saitozyma podzolica]
MSPMDMEQPHGQSIAHGYHPQGQGQGQAHPQAQGYPQGYPQSHPGGPGDYSYGPPPPMSATEHVRRASMATAMSVSALPPGMGYPDEGEGGETARQQRSVSQPAPLLDQSHLRPGKSASLLSHDRTLELYRENAKKTNDPELIFEFAVFMIDAAKSMVPTDPSTQTPTNPTDPHAPAPPPKSAHPTPTTTNPGAGAARSHAALIEKRDELIKEAITLLKKLADRSYPDAQYFLADCYANGIGTVRGRQDFDRAFPLFVLAAKHGHPDASYRAGTCCEHGWGCRRESAKAIQYYKKATVALHPGAMYRLGTAELNGNLGLTRSPKEGVKWLKRSAEHATEEFPHALHELALLHERGIDNVLFVDHEYAAELLAQASELGYAPSAFKLGECYEYGKMDCPVDPALSIHYYNIAATQGHPDASFALTAWYLVGSPGVLPQSDTEAYLWAKKAAELGLAKAQYAVGYFTETGIGIEADPSEAMKWYKQAAEGGDKRAQKRLVGGTRGQSQALDRRLELEAMKEEHKGNANGKGDGCVVM